MVRSSSGTRSGPSGELRRLRVTFFANERRVPLAEGPFGLEGVLTEERVIVSIMNSIAVSAIRDAPVAADRCAHLPFFRLIPSMRLESNVVTAEGDLQIHGAVRTPAPKNLSSVFLESGTKS